ncbi:hypothetical protein FHS18_000094 [Paenibacillus phyllosphaerae]|uniref:Regulator of SigK n=1 Tax=Paenibacillus phyllosphaerae TaxID=274593 RepID=A0A7W5ATW0_9BACL|nr:anti-sigma factor [Paenibacillus phyllosphaerae]MBB3108066.1 hypothetical protein [Paenibacillus phyllosphaerae]
MDGQNRDCELLEIYLLDGLNAKDKAEFEVHLSRCEACQANQSELQQVIDLLPLAVEEQPVPAGMKKRVLSNVLGQEANADTTGAKQSTSLATERRLNRKNGQSRWLIPGLSAAVALLVFFAGYQQVTIHDLNQQLAGSDIKPGEPVKVEQAVKLSPAAEDFVSEGLATIVIDQKGTHLLVQAEQLPQLKGTEAFQVWLIKGETKVSAGTFLAEQGNGALYYSFEPNDYDTIAITLEPDALGDQPRGKMVLAAPIRTGDIG